jgi:transposase
MARNTVLDSRMRSLIIKKVNGGESYRNVANVFNISIGVISKIVKQYRTTDSLSNKYVNCGRKKKLSRRAQQHLVLEIAKNPTANSEYLKSFLHNHLNIIVTAQTVRNYLVTLGFRCSLSLKKPLLTKRHKEMRLKFAKKYVNQPPEFWRKVVFTDETRISVINNARRQFLWRKKGDKLRITLPTVKHPPSVMLWGSFTASEPGKIQFLRNQESCNSQWYLKVLNNEVRSTVTEAFGRDKSWILQDDGAPCHRSKIVKDWILKRR